MILKYEYRNYCHNLYSQRKFLGLRTWYKLHKADDTLHIQLSNLGDRTQMNSNTYQIIPYQNRFLCTATNHINLSHSHSSFSTPDRIITSSNLRSMQYRKFLRRLDYLFSYCCRLHFTSKCHQYICHSLHFRLKCSQVYIFQSSWFNLK